MMELFGENSLRLKKQMLTNQKKKIFAIKRLKEILLKNDLNKLK